MHTLRASLLRRIVNIRSLLFFVHLIRNKKIMTVNEVSGKDLDVILDLLESDYFEEDLQAELDEIAEEVRALDYVL